MKSLVLCLTLICSLFGFSQTETFEINWKGSTSLSTPNKVVEIPSFNTENHNFSFENGLIFSKQWPINGTIDETSAKIISIETVEISRTDLNQLPLNTIPNGPQLKVANAQSRNNSSGAVEIYPIFYNNGVLTKIVRFTIDYRMRIQRRISTSNAFMSSSSLKSGSWYRFAVDTTGVYKITKNFKGD